MQMLSPHLLEFGEVVAYIYFFKLIFNDVRSA